jgi:hypothetical protein
VRHTYTQVCPPDMSHGIDELMEVIDDDDTFANDEDICRTTQFTDRVVIVSPGVHDAREQAPSCSGVSDLRYEIADDEDNLATKDEVFEIVNDDGDSFPIRPSIDERRSTDDEADSLKLESDDEGIRKPVQFDDSLFVEYDNRGQCYGPRTLLRQLSQSRESLLLNGLSRAIIGKPTKWNYSSNLRIRRNFVPWMCVRACYPIQRTSGRAYPKALEMF